MRYPTFEDSQNPLQPTTYNPAELLLADIKGAWLEMDDVMDQV